MVSSRLLASRILSSITETDHRYIGLKQKLFFFSDLSKGSCFFLPRGAHIYNKLIQYLKNEYKKRNYEEVITPNVYNCQIWKTSGHWDHYKGDMIKFPIGEREFSLKPMNCPGHCIMFKQLDTRTDSELPVRWADFGVLHRNELSGSLAGLTRLRRFQQDDAHIFCTPDQVESEIDGCLQFARDVYGRFDFSFDLKLSLRPESYMGEPHLWDKAEQALRNALDKSGLSWTEQKFEGAFYGPKIDLIVKDCLNRRHQCATIQLDFQLPERFELTYKNKKDKTLSRPVIIHRAILGSVERFIAMLAENYRGSWPFWLSPLQAQVIPLHANMNSYAKSIGDRLRQEGFWVDCDLRDFDYKGKIRDALLIHYNCILVIGQKEMETGTVTCRFLYDEESTASKPDSNSSNNKKKRRSVRNISMSIEELIGLFKDFDKRHVNRLDIELLRLYASQ